MEQTSPRRYTVEEYFALEVQSEVKHEYVDCEILAMVGANILHNLIALNFATSFRQALRGKGCRVAMEAVRQAVEEGRH